MLMVNEFLLGGGPGGEGEAGVDSGSYPAAVAGCWLMPVAERPGPRGTPRARAAAGPSADRLSTGLQWLHCVFAVRGPPPTASRLYRNRILYMCHGLRACDTHTRTCRSYHPPPFLVKISSDVSEYVPTFLEATSGMRHQ